MRSRRCVVARLAWMALLLAGCDYDFVLGEQVSTTDAGAVSSRAQPGEAGASCLKYEDCQSGDCASAICVERARWICAPYSSCVWDGGSCGASAASCSSYQDCCSHDCWWGECLEANPTTVLPPQTGDSQGCSRGGACTFYSDCCSKNCYDGKCAAAPPDEICAFGSPCSAFSDCCSFECRAGICADSTAPNQ